MLVGTPCLRSSSRAPSPDRQSVKKWRSREETREVLVVWENTAPKRLLHSVLPAQRCCARRTTIAYIVSTIFSEPSPRTYQPARHASPVSGFYKKPAGIEPSIAPISSLVNCKSKLPIICCASLSLLMPIIAPVIPGLESSQATTTSTIVFPCLAAISLIASLSFVILTRLSGWAYL